MKTPWQYAETGNEHSHQVALFMWAGMAQRFGLLANNPNSYLEPGFAARHLPLVDPIPELQWLHAIKNAGHGDAIRGNKSRAEGVKAGVPDIFLPVPKMLFDEYEADGNNEILKCGLYIELKRPGSAQKAKGVVSTPQDKWQDYLKSAGYAVEVCYGWEEARDIILKYFGR